MDRCGWQRHALRSECTRSARVSAEIRSGCACCLQLPTHAAAQSASQCASSQAEEWKRGKIVARRNRIPKQKQFSIGLRRRLRCSQHCQRRCGEHGGVVNPIVKAGIRDSCLRVLRISRGEQRLKVSIRSAPRRQEVSQGHSGAEGAPRSYERLIERLCILVARCKRIAHVIQCLTVAIDAFANLLLRGKRDECYFRRCDDP